MVAFSLVRPDGTFAVDVLPASLVAAAGMSLAFIPSLGLAVMTALATSQGADRLGDPAALTDGYSAAFLGAAGIAVAGALLAAALLRTGGAPAVAEADEVDREPVAA